jgi:hypothetical protein
MGLDPNSVVGRAVLRAAGYQQDAARRVVKPERLEHAAEGYVGLWLPGDPPTATHHAKSIEYRTRPGGGVYPKLVNDPRLKAAWDHYLAHMPERASLVPIRPPYLVTAQFWWALPADPVQWPLGALPGGWRWQEKPDLDNSIKVLQDVLALRGYLIDDSMVVSFNGSGKWWADEHHRPGVRVRVRTITDGKTCPVEPAAGYAWRGEVMPLPTVEALNLPGRKRGRLARVVGHPGLPTPETGSGEKGAQP